MPLSPTSEMSAPAHASSPGGGRRPWYDLGFTYTPRQALILLALLAFGVAFAYALEWVVTHFVDLDPERIRRWVDGFGLLAPLAFIVLHATTIIVSPLPSLPVDIAGGLAFGVVPGTLYVLGGALVGATVDFYLARWLGRPYLERRLNPRVMAEVDYFAERMGFRVIVITRLLPSFNYKWVSYAAGLTRMAYRPYVIASLLGSVLPTVGIVYVGDTLLTHPGRSALVFTALVVWSAALPVLFLLWAGVRALFRHARRPHGRSRAAAHPRAEDTEVPL